MSEEETVNVKPRVFSTKEPPTKEELDALYKAVSIFFRDDEAMLMCLAMLVPLALFNFNASPEGASKYCGMIIDVYGKMLADFTDAGQETSAGEVLH